MNTSTLIKNENGSFSYGDFTVLAPVYDKELKKHVFNILQKGFVPEKHIGNFLTLKNAIKKITEAMQKEVKEEPVLIEEEPVKAEIEHDDTPLMSALKAVVNDPSNLESYAIFRDILDEVLSEELV